MDKLTKDLKKFDKRYQDTMDKQEDQNKQIQDRFGKEEEQTKDIFRWLKVPSKYQHLRRLLRAKLVELITSRKHYEVFENFIEDFEKKNNSTINNVASTKLKLDDEALGVTP